MKQTAPYRIAFNHTAFQAGHYKQELLNAFERVIDAGNFFYGVEVKKLEQKLSGMYDGYCVSVASGHDSLVLALQALNLRATDEVIFPVNVYPTAFPVYMSSGKPVPVDVDVNGQMIPAEIEKAITPKTRTIILVHLYGMTGDIDGVKALARRHGIVFIEDCAQAFGTVYKNKAVGSFGDMACFSFYPTKNFGTLGDGGAVITKNKRYAQQIRAARQYGEKIRYKSSFVSGHSRLAEVQAAILNVYLENYNKTRAKRKKIYALYQKELCSEGVDKYVRLLESSQNSDPAIHLLVVEVIKRNALLQYLEKYDIECHIHYPFPIHKIPAFRQVKNYQTFPVAERLSKKIVSLPFHEYLAQDDIYYIVKRIKDFYT